jgi:hypothetical protein
MHIMLECLHNVTYLRNVLDCVVGFVISTNTNPFIFMQLPIYWNCILCDKQHKLCVS